MKLRINKSSSLPLYDPADQTSFGREQRRWRLAKAFLKGLTAILIIIGVPVAAIIGFLYVWINY